MGREKIVAHEWSLGNWFEIDEKGNRRYVPRQSFTPEQEKYLEALAFANYVALKYQALEDKSITMIPGEEKNLILNRTLDKYDKSGYIAYQDAPDCVQDAIHKRGERRYL